MEDDWGLAWLRQTLSFVDRLILSVRCYIKLSNDLNDGGRWFAF